MIKLSMLSLFILFFVSCGKSNNSGDDNGIGGFQYSYTGNIVILGQNMPGLSTPNQGVISLYTYDQNIQQQLNQAYTNNPNAQITVASDEPLKYSSNNQYTSGVYPTFKVKAIYGGTITSSGNTTTNQLCGSLYASFDGFNVRYIMNSTTGQIQVAGGDATTTEILRQLPPGQTAYGVCANVVSTQGSIRYISNLRQN